MITKRTALVAITLLALGVRSAEATQHLVRAGQSWDQLAERATPGDEIILMPGNHRAATLTGLRGEPRRPIVIRGLDPKRPPTIEATRYGIRLIGPAHVRLRDVVITGATINGVAVEPDDDNPEAVLAQDVTISNVVVQNTGPAGVTGSATERHAVHLRHVVDTRVKDCRLLGWVGSGVEIVGGENIRIEDSVFEGREDRLQLNGIRLRGRTSRVRISRCRFSNTGEHSVCIGGQTALDDFRPAVAEDARPESMFEASRVHVTECTMEGGLCAVAYVNCNMAIVRNCTIVRPRHVVMSIRHEQTDQRFGVADRCVFGSNLITWEAGDLTGISHLGAGAHSRGLNIEQNLWWTEGPETIESLGPLPGRSPQRQITNLDPKLDEGHMPSNAAASAFGAHDH